MLAERHEELTGCIYYVQCTREASGDLFDHDVSREEH